MSTSKVPKGYRLKVESHPLPQSRVERVAAIEAILAPGGVQKLILDIVKGISIHRFVKEEPIGDVPQEMFDDDIMSAVRNAEMEELHIPTKIMPFEAIFLAFSSVTDKRLRPKTFVVKSKEDLKSWLGLQSPLLPSEIFCVPVIEHKEMPDGTMLLVASKEDDPEEIAVSLKIDMGHAPQGKKK